jgi:hypothetical protein
MTKPQNPAAGIQVYGIYRKAHREGVDAIAWNNPQTTSGRKFPDCAANQTFHPMEKRFSNFHFGGQAGASSYIYGQEFLIHVDLSYDLPRRERMRKIRTIRITAKRIEPMI